MSHNQHDLQKWNQLWHNAIRDAIVSQGNHSPGSSSASPVDDKLVGIPAKVLARLTGLARPALESLCDNAGKAGHTPSELYACELDAIDIAHAQITTAGLVPDDYLLS